MYYYVCEGVCHKKMKDQKNPENTKQKNKIFGLICVHFHAILLVLSLIPSLRSYLYKYVTTETPLSAGLMSIPYLFVVCQSLF